MEQYPYFGSIKVLHCFHIKLTVFSNHWFGTHSRVGRKLGESSLFLRTSLHLLTVSKRRKVSPTLNRVARQRAISLRVGGPGDSWMCCVSCSTSFFWQPFMSDCNRTTLWLQNKLNILLVESMTQTVLDSLPAECQYLSGPRLPCQLAVLCIFAYCNMYTNCWEINVK
jgi:hypothetical protein